MREAPRDNRTRMLRRMVRRRFGAVVLLVLATFAVATPAQDGRALRQQIDRLLAQNKAAEALVLLDRAIATSAPDPVLFEQRTLARSMTEDYDGAIADATKAIALAPKSWRAHYERGFAHYRKRELREALADYEAASALAPNVAAMHGERGDALSELGEPVLAIAAYDRAIELEPGWAQAWSGRGTARRSLTDFPAALTDARRASELAPEDPGVWYLLAGVAFDSHDDVAALAAGAEWVRRVQPALRPRALDLFGRMVWRMGDSAAAVARLREGIAACGGDLAAAPIRLSLACVHLGTGDLAAAAEELSAAATRADAALAPHVALMQWCVEARSKGLDAAGRQLRKAVAAMPQLSAAEHQLVDLCTLGAGEAPPASSENPMMACPSLFLTAWRARCAGDEVAAQRQLRRCVNTGAREWMQWALAVALLRAGPDGAALRPSLGVKIGFPGGDGAAAAIVEALDDDGAAACQGLRVGDEIVALAGAPITRAAWAAVDRRAREGLDLRLTIRRAGSTEVRIFRLGVAD